MFWQLRAPDQPATNCKSYPDDRCPPKKLPTAGVSFYLICSGGRRNELVPIQGRCFADGRWAFAIRGCVQIFGAGFSKRFGGRFPVRPFHRTDKTVTAARDGFNPAWLFRGVGKAIP